MKNDKKDPKLETKGGDGQGNNGTSPRPNQDRKPKDQGLHKKPRRCGRHRGTHNGNTRGGNGQGGSYTPSSENKQDPKWYGATDSMVRNMASFPFNEVTGTNIAQSDKVPGIITFDYIPSIANSESKDFTYATRSANAYFQYITQGYTGGVDFEAPDLMMNSLVAANIVSNYMLGYRVYGLIWRYYQLNTYYVKPIVESLGFSYVNLMSNLADFRARMELFASQFNKIVALPKDFPLLQRWSYINSRVFSDSDDIEYATLYAYRPRMYLTLDGTSLNTGTSVRYQTFNGNDGTHNQTLTVQGYFNILEEQLNSITNDDSRSMFGAVRRVYSDDMFLKLPETFDNSYRTEIVINDIVQATIHNARWVHGYSMNNFQTPVDAKFKTDSSTSYKYFCYQTDVGQINSEYQWVNLSNTDDAIVHSTNDEVLLDLYGVEGSPENILDIVSNMTVYDMDSTKKVFTIYPRTEIICEVWATALDGATPVYTDIKQSIKANDATQLIRIARASHLDSHPFFYVIDGEFLNAYIGEINKYTKVNKSDIKNIFDRSMFTLLMLPVNNESVTK